MTDKTGMTRTSQLIVKGISISTFKIANENYISLTDIARNKNAEEPKVVVKNWIRSRTIEFLGLWEQLNKPNFKGVEFDSFLFEAGSNSFTISPSKHINQKLVQAERLVQLNEMAILQMKSLLTNKSIKKLK